MNGNDIRRMVLAEVPRHQRTPVSALRNVAFIAELRHHVGNGRGDLRDVDATLAGRTGESVPGHRHDHHVKPFA